MPKTPLPLWRMAATVGRLPGLTNIAAWVAGAAAAGLLSELVSAPPP